MYLEDLSTHQRTGGLHGVTESLHLLRKHGGITPYLLPPGGKEEGLK